MTARIRPSQRRPHRLVAQLRAARLGADVSQEVLAPRIHVSRPQLSHWERGAARPPLEALEAWARAFGLELVLRPAVKP